MAETPKARLPRDDAYWDALAAEIGRDAAAPLAAYASNDGGWSALLSRRAPWLVAASAAAMLVLWLALPPASPAGELGWIEGSLAPTERAGSLVVGSAPPSLDALMAQFPPPLDDGEPR